MISTFFEWFLEKQFPCNAMFNYALLYLNYAKKRNILITCIFEGNLADDNNYSLYHSVIFLEQSTINNTKIKNIPVWDNLV